MYVGNVYALNAATGGEIWSFSSIGHGHSSPAFANGTVYVAAPGMGASPDVIWALNPTDGSVLWHNDLLVGTMFASPAIGYQGTMLYIGSANNLTALCTLNNTIVWQYAAGDRILSSPAFSDGMVYFFSEDNNVYALDASTGAKIWNYAIGSGTSSGSFDSSPAVANGRVYIGGWDNNVWALDASTGAKIWNHPTSGAVYSSPVVDNGVVYVGSGDGKVYAIGGGTPPPTNVPVLNVTVMQTSGGFLNADHIMLFNSTWSDNTSHDNMDYANFDNLALGTQYNVKVTKAGYLNVTATATVTGENPRVVNVTLAQLGQMYAPVTVMSENGTAVSGMTTTYKAPTGAVNGNSTAGTKEYLAYTMQVAGNDTVAVGVEIPPRLTVSMTANGNNPMNVTLDGVPLSYQYTTGTFTVDSSAFYTATNATVVAIVPSQSNGKTLNITFKGTLRGDATGDGIITPSDASFTFQCYLRSRNVLPTYDYADVAGTNHQFLPSDASFVFQNYLGTRNL